MRISVLIPSRNRPALLAECLQSCLAQTQAPDEIVVGDDSDDERSAALAAEIARTSPVPIHLRPHRPPLGQGGNVHDLFTAARGDAFCLIHDDDLLLPNALADLAPALTDPQVIVAFGKQRLVAPDGSDHESAAQRLNATYRRTAAHAGRVPDLLESALTQQLPNNGFLVRASAARAVSYLEAQARFGNACDFGFGVLLARRFPTSAAHFVDTYTASYRELGPSITRGGSSNDNVCLAFDYVSQLPADLLRRPAIIHWLNTRAPMAVVSALERGEIANARRWVWSRWHRPHLLRPAGLRRLWRVLTADPGPTRPVR